MESSGSGVTESSKKDEPDFIDMSGENEIVEVHSSVIVNIQNKALAAVIDAVSPWINKETVVRPMPIKFVNEAVGEFHARIEIEQGVLIVTMLPRIRNPKQDTLIVPRGDERLIDLAQRQGV